MGTEIERKFLVQLAHLPDAARANGAEFSQGYLAFEPSVRVRLAVDERGGAEHAWITVKGPGAISRAEYEYAIPPDDARGLLTIARATLTKIRYHVEHRGHVWDLDRFTGAHDGLWLAEVELSREDEAFERPAWLGDEVTHDARYTNGALARAGRAP